MTDIRLVQSGVFPYQTEVSVDWLLLGNGTLDDTQALATCRHCRARHRSAWPTRDDVLPDPDSTDRRGWWGDLEAEEIWHGWPIGTRLWLMRREKIAGPEAHIGDRRWRGSSSTFAKRSSRSSICGSRRAWTIAVERIDRQRIDALIRLYRGPELAIDLRYQVLWDGIQP